MTDNDDENVMNPRSRIHIYGVGFRVTLKLEAMVEKTSEKQGIWKPHTINSWNEEEKKNVCKINIYLLLLHSISMGRFKKSAPKKVSKSEKKVSQESAIEKEKVCKSNMCLLLLHTINMAIGGSTWIY